MKGIRRFKALLCRLSRRQLLIGVIFSYGFIIGCAATLPAVYTLEILFPKDTVDFGELRKSAEASYHIPLLTHAILMIHEPRPGTACGLWDGFSFERGFLVEKRCALPGTDGNG